MSDPDPIASNGASILTPDPPFIKFPPFPEPPSGVTIMPFRDFKPRGIQLFSEAKWAGDDVNEEDAELDALGIPTVELRVKHATDECKSNSRKRRKKKKAAATAEAVPVKKLPWYEEWEEGEHLRVTKGRSDTSISPVDRLFQSAYDFRTGRPWPPVSSGLNNLWDQFRLFTGLLVNPSGFRKAGSKNNARAESPDFESDDDDGLDDGASRPTKRQRSGEGEGLAVDEEDGAFDDPHKSHEEARAEKITIFLSDPEKAVRIFLSSYMREHGLIWSERNLIQLPRLISFFIAFVLRNRVLPEPAYQRGLKRALEAIEHAKKELPLTNQVGQSLPDAFNESCREYFGRQGGINWSIVDATAITTQEKDVNVTVTDITNGFPSNVALPTAAEMQLKDAVEDNVDMEDAVITPPTVLSPVNRDAARETSGGWDTSGRENGWGNTEPQNGWAQNGSGTWGNETQTWDGQGADNEAEFDLVSDWADSKPSWADNNLRSLFKLLGPSAFPLTHTTGIVECSTRRISAIHFPPNHPKAAPSSTPQESLGKAATEANGTQGWTPSACGVEAELDARFAKVILEPWGREEGDISKPEIWSTSRGPVVDPRDPSKVMAVASTGARKPHNPLMDNIALLVEPSLAETLALVPGLGLGAMWIEIARQKRDGGVNASSGVAQVDDSTPGRFWYHEDVTGIFPSYYTTQAKE